MPFESLSERLQMTVRRLTGRAVLTEKDIDEMMNSALNSAIDELDTQQNDSDSPNEIENFG